MKTWFYKLTGWRFLRPSRAPWGESTSLWTEGDWRWFRRYRRIRPPTNVSDLAGQQREQKMDTMAPGCCSAVSPCSHQQRDPSTICDVCQRAALVDQIRRERDRSSSEIMDEIEAMERETA